MTMHNFKNAKEDLKKRSFTNSGKLIRWEVIKERQLVYNNFLISPPDGSSLSSNNTATKRTMSATPGTSSKPYTLFLDEKASRKSKNQS